MQLLKDVLYMLSTNPVTFHEYMSTVADALNDSITTDSQLEDVAEAIFEQVRTRPKTVESDRAEVKGCSRWMCAKTCYG